MKKSISILITIVMAVTLFGGCKKATNTTTPESNPKEKSELVNGRFEQTRKITVEVYDRANDGGSKPEDNFYTKFIKEGMLRDHNVEVTFKPVPRWTEVQQINNLLAAGDAPDVCVTYDYPTIQTYSNMGGIMDLAPVLEKNKKDLTNLWGLLTDTNIYYDQDPEKKTIWAI
jgi:putative aldouronate transport system substrate-binding protein